MNDAALARFSDKIELIPFSTCWHWNGSIERNGYGRFKIDGVKFSAHRIAYEHWKGPLVDGLELDHLCRNRACVNPAHLEQVTHRENARRGLSGIFNAMKTHCSKGHLFNEANTRFESNVRKCLECNRAASAAWRKRKSLTGRV